MMFITRWCIFSFTWIVRSRMLNYVKKLILVNAYMLIDWDVVGEYIYINWIVNVVGYCIYVEGWWIVGECIYVKWLVMIWWIVCVNICIELSHMFMHTLKVRKTTRRGGGLNCVFKNLFLTFWKIVPKFRV